MPSNNPVKFPPDLRIGVGRLFLPDDRSLWPRDLLDLLLQKDLEIWVTKDHRVKESWIKKYVVDPPDVSSLPSARRN
ncbi:hypothetical protein POTOM_037658 [Populus tomentosa]|uniref:Uncharacterized protein n=1 Tax=Populus tomentosa TaxID=118781 RepID=A0A8X7YW49_POPTO|nr:hypothetical protein POTOM_037658 [Populus tomentosa]